MDRTLADFIRALRGADVRVSVAETLDALRVVNLVGWADKGTLRDSFSLLLAKSEEEKERFFEVFDSFFSFRAFEPEPPRPPGAGVNGEPPPGRPGGEPLEGLESREGMESGGGGASQLGQMLLADDRAGLALAMQEAAQAADARGIRFFTQKGIFTRRMLEAMGIEALNRDIYALEKDPAPGAQARARALREARARLQEQVSDFIEKQIALYGGEQVRRLRENTLRRIKLTNADQQDLRRMQHIVERMAKRLVALHSKRKRVENRGQLDVRRTLRKNMAYDGLLIEPQWKSRRIERPHVFAVCDVSKSVSAYARFLLMFLYSLNEVLPRVRSFAFSGHLEEISRVFKEKEAEGAMNEILERLGFGSTDYGRALEDLERLAMADINNRATVIILGDGRSNYGELRTDILKAIYRKCRRVIWLNPENRYLWDTGDSEMRRFTPAVHQAEVCNTLVHLERVMDNLLATAV